MTANDAFQNAVRDALNHLYDPERLQSSPLIQAFALPTTWQASGELQQLLLAAIHNMQPPPDEAAASIRRRIYNILQLRYEQQFSQKEVAAQLGVGVRQYRRLQTAALQALTMHLLQEVRVDQLPAPPSCESTEAVAADLPETLQWISGLERDEEARVDHVVEDAVQLVKPLAERHNDTVYVKAKAPVSGAIPAIVLRQALLTLLNVAILQGSGRAIVLTVHADRQDVKTTIFSEQDPQPCGMAMPVSYAELAIAQQMMQYFGGDLSVTFDPLTGAFHAELRCRSAELIPVLVVDDHADTLTLMERYTVDSRYAMIVVNDPAQTVAQAALHQPSTIVLDVMMPALDGWEVLTQLKQNERTAHLPVLVCTVLDQSELALSLGASGFLRKPVTRQALLEALALHETPSAPTAP